MGLGALFDGMQRTAAAVLTTLPDRCNIERPATTQGAAGGQIPAFAIVGSGNIPCLYSPIPKMLEAIKGEQIESASDYVFTFPAGTDVAAKDRIHLLARGIEAARYFRVDAVKRFTGIVIELEVTTVE